MTNWIYKGDESMGLFDNLFGEKKAEPPKKKVEQQKKLIENAGGCIITRSLLDGTSKLRWLFREQGVNPNDNGWRAIGDSDTQEYIDDPSNSVVVDFDTLAKMEPAVLVVYQLPIGTDLEFHYDETGRYFIDNNTGKRIP